MQNKGAIVSMQETTLCDHIPRLSGKVVTNTKCWVPLEPNHSSMATFSNLKAGKIEVEGIDWLHMGFLHTWEAILGTRSTEEEWEKVWPETES